MPQALINGLFGGAFWLMIISVLLILAGSLSGSKGLLYSAVAGCMTAGFFFMLIGAGELKGGLLIIFLVVELTVALGFIGYMQITGWNGALGGLKDIEAIYIGTVPETEEKTETGN